MNNLYSEFGLKIEKILGEFFGTHRSIPIEMSYDPNCKGVKVIGESYHWTTIGGRPIQYPSAYKWPKIYCASTRRILCSIAWLRNVKLEELQFDGQPTIRATGLVRHYGKYTVAPGWIRSKKVILVAHKGLAYHAPRTNTTTTLTAEDYLKAIESAKVAWALRERAAKLKKIETEQLSYVWVGVDDSLLSGNCSAGTERQRELLQIRLKAKGEIGAVRADFLLLSRNDSYVRRAIGKAIETRYF